MLNKRFFLVLLGIFVGCLFLIAAPQLPSWSHQRLHMPGGYTIPDRFERVSLASPPTSDALLPAARNCLANWAEVGSGARLRIVTDDSIPPMVSDAFKRASFEKNLTVNFESLESGDLNSRSTRDLSRGEFDATLLLAYFPAETNHRDSLERFVRVVAVPELLASDWAQLPLPLMAEISRTAQREFGMGRRARIVDPAGTDFSFSYNVDPLGDEEIRQKLKSQFPPSFQVSLRVNQSQSSNGWIVVHSGLSGFFPLGKFQINDGKLNRVLGGGSLGERFKASLLRPESQVYLTELRISTSPLALRYTRGYSGSAFRWGHESASQRAGVATFQFETRTAATRTGMREQGLQVYFPTLRIGNQTLVEEGYLKSLESPGIVRLAASLGVSRMLVPQCGAESLPRLPAHVNPTIKTVTSSEALRPALQSMFREWIQLAASEDVLVLSDETVPPLLAAAVLEQLGTDRRFDIQDIPVPAVPKDAAGRLEAYGRYRLAEEIWDRMANSDVVIALSHFPFERLRRGDRSFREWLREVKTRFIAAAGLPEIFASPWGQFPTALLRQVARYTFSRARLLRRVTLKTGEGTNLSFEFQRVRSIPKILPGVGRFAYYLAPANHFFAFVPVRSQDVEGTLITRRVDGMPAPRLVLTIKEGKISHVGGGGAAGDWIRKHSRMGEGFRLKRLGTYVHPKAFPWEESPYPGWTPAYWAASGGLYRSGIIHVEFDGVTTFAVQLQLPTVQIGTRELISRGRFLVLENPNLRTTAAQQGYDPERWLKEDWIPRIGRPR